MKGKISFSSTARRMQRFRQPQKMQGPLFPIEDDELIDAINDYKNISDDDTINNSQYCKTDNSFDEFDAENHMEVIEVDMFMDNNDCIDENEVFNDGNDKENISGNIQKETEKTVNMFCKIKFFISNNICTYCIFSISLISLFYYRLYLL